MNANELADVFNTYDEPHDWGAQAQAMLRQQQERIDRQAGEYEALVRIKENKQAEIEALKKEAALQRLSDFTQEVEKTLTDEEIKKVWQENLVVMGNDLDFAKAILRKAQEK